MKYTFYFVNNNRVVNEWSGGLENNKAAERFADGAAICSMAAFGEIGIYGVSEDGKHIINRQLTRKRANVLFAHLNKKELNN